MAHGGLHNDVAMQIASRLLEATIVFMIFWRENGADSKNVYYGSGGRAATLDLCPILNCRMLETPSDTNLTRNR